VLAGLAVFVPSSSFATPSSTMWSPMTLDIQGFGIGHWGVDNYFTIFRTEEEGSGSFPTDAGFTIGVVPFEKFKIEVGIDLVEASDDSIYFNTKMGFPEGALAKSAPALQLGIFNVGTDSDANDYNILDLVIGKTFKGFGRISAGPYYGNPDVLVDANGEDENTGWMVAYDRGFHPVEGPEGEFNRFVFAADYASGDNALGAAGVGLYYFFTKDISLLMGPVFFNEESINGEWKWSIQLDINQALFGGK
jgi:hypothetical protein